MKIALHCVFALIFSPLLHLYSENGHLDRFRFLSDNEVILSAYSLIDVIYLVLAALRGVAVL